MPDPDAEQPSVEPSLAEMATQWSLLRLAHPSGGSDGTAARAELALRYASAIRRYLAVVVKDSYAADEIAQDVMVRLMRGDFGVGDPERGRFRDLLKRSIRNMAYNRFAKEKLRTGAPLDEQLMPGEEPELEDPWLGQWVRSLLDLTWRGLERHQAEHAGSVAYTLLRLRSNDPEADSQALAERLSAQAGRPFNAAAVRQQLRRARLRFAQLLVEEVARGLPEASPQAMEDELLSLGLMGYVRDFLPADWRETGQLRCSDGQA